MTDENATREFSADDLAMLGGKEADTPPPANDGAGDKTAEQKPPAKTEGEAKGGEQPGPKGDKPATIATGADAEAEDKTKDDAAAKAKAEKVDPNELSAELRQLIAEHYAAGDKKVLAAELRRLERIKDIKSLWGMYREAEGKLTSGGLIKKPGKDAKPEEIAEFNKAMGVPEKPEDYFKDIKLENGAVIGEADKPIVDIFATAMHKAGATPAVMNAMLNTYYAHQESQAAAMDEADDEFRRESERALKDEYGASFKRMTNAIGPLFSTAPGGADVKNDGSLYARLMGGRTADGRIIGNDPDIVRWLVSLAQDVNPAATVVEDGNQSGVTIDAEIKQIEQRMKDDRRGYFKDEAAQARYRELITARDKIRARA